MAPGDNWGYWVDLNGDGNLDYSLFPDPDNNTKEDPGTRPGNNANSNVTVVRRVRIGGMIKLLKGMEHHPKINRERRILN